MSMWGDPLSPSKKIPPPPQPIIIDSTNEYTYDYIRFEPVGFLAIEELPSRL